jgi:hypothetical protein
MVFFTWPIAGSKKLREHYQKKNWLLLAVLDNVYAVVMELESRGRIERQ